MKRFLLAFVFAWDGLKTAFSEEANLKFHAGAAVIAIAGGMYYDITATEWLAITLAIAMVILTELINTAIEHMVDLITLERNPLAGKIKDIAAAAVLVSATAAVVVAAVIFGKYII